MHLQSLILLPTLCPVCVGGHTQPNCCVIGDRAAGTAVHGWLLLKTLCTQCCGFKPSLGFFKAVSIHLCVSTSCFENWPPPQTKMVPQAETSTCKSHIQYSRLDQEQWWTIGGGNNFTLAEIAEKSFFFSSIKQTGSFHCIQLTCPFPQHHLETEWSLS